MKPDAIRNLFQQVQQGELSPDDAVQQLRRLPYEDLGFANVDHHRALRTGMAEAVFGPGKDPEHMAGIFASLSKRGNNVLATRASAEQYRAVKRKVRKAEYDELARAVVLRQDKTVHGKGKIVVVSAGTSDIPVAAEARLTAELMGNEVEHVFDVGVAGLHRLLAR